MFTHIVSKTDTLEGISLKYNVSIAKIKKANKIYSNNVLLCMDKIFIPEEDDVISVSSISKSKASSIYNDENGGNSYSNLPSDINIIYSNNNNNNTMNDNISISSAKFYNSSNYNKQKCSSLYNYSPYRNDFSESAPNSPVIIKSHSNQLKGDSVSERIYYSSNTKDYKRSTSELSSLNELFESIDKTVMDTVNKSNITLPLLIKSQMEVYQDIPTYDPSKDINNHNDSLQKCYSNASIGSNSNKSNFNNSVSSLSFYDGYDASSDCDNNLTASPKELRKSFLRQEHEKLNKIMDKLSISSISTNMDGIHNLVNRLSSRDVYSSNSEFENPSSQNKQKNNDYLELAKIV